MNSEDKLQRLQHLVAMARHWTDWANSLDARGDSEEAAAIRRAAERYTAEAECLRGDS